MRNFSPRKLVTLMLPVFGTVSIVGTGFSLWVLVDKNDPKLNPQLDVNVVVREEASGGFFDGRSLMIKGTQEQASAGNQYIFPSMLVFNEGHGLPTDLKSGLNFYKKVDVTASNGAHYLEPFLDDSVKISYYRENSVTLEQFEKEGLEFHLDCDIEIVGDLANFITIVNDGINKPITIANNVKCTFDYTPLFSVNKPDINGQSIVDEIALGAPELDPNSNIVEPFVNLDLNKNYERLDYIFNFSNIFRYTDFSKKPTTVETYNNLKNALDKKQSKIYFTFKSYYKVLGDKNAQKN